MPEMTTSRTFNAGGARQIDDEAPSGGELDLRLRVLREGDEAMLDAFLAGRPDTPIALRESLRQGGIEDDGRTYQATWVGAALVDPDADTQTVIATVTLLWNGTLLLHAPHELDGLLNVLAGAAPREVAEVAGPLDQVEASMTHLLLRDRPLKTRTYGQVMTLAVADLKKPDPMRESRPAMGEELAMLGDWLAALDEETIAATRTPEGDIAARQRMRRLHDLRQELVVTVDDQPVALGAVAHRFEDAIAIDPVYVPADLRGKGHAGSLLAALVQDAARDGVARATIMVDKENPAAVRICEKLGFVAALDWSVARYFAS